MHLVPVGPLAELDRYIGYWQPYATSHEELDRDQANAGRGPERCSHATRGGSGQAVWTADQRGTCPHTASSEVTPASGEGRPSKPTWITVVTPQLLDRMLARTAFGGQLSEQHVALKRPDNLYGPVLNDHGARGRFFERARTGSWQFWLTTPPADADRLCPCVGPDRGGASRPDLVLERLLDQSDVVGACPTE